MENASLILDLIGIGLCCLFLILLIRYKPFGSVNYYLALSVVSLFSTILLDTFLDSFEGYVLSCFFETLISASMYLHVRRLIGDRTKRLDIIHFLVPFTNLVSFGAVLILKIPEDVYYETVMCYVQVFLNFIFTFLYAILIIVLYFRMKWKLEVDELKTSWVGVLMIANLVIAFVNFVYLFAYAIADDNEWLWLMDSLLLTASLAFIGVRGYQLGLFSIEEQTEEKEEGDRWEELFTELDALVRGEQLFTNPILKIEDIAKRMVSNSRYVSKAVNSSYGASVTNYLNDLRLEKLKELLKNEERKHINIDVLAQESGFNSKSSFNRFFKLKEGMTPSEYRKKFFG